MLNVYIKPYCPYCSRVIAANEVIKAPVVWLDVMSDPKLREELVAKGGKSQTPFLEDTDQGVMMYESGDIIAYLQTNYGKGNPPNIPPAGNVCPIE